MRVVCRHIWSRPCCQCTACRRWMVSPSRWPRHTFRLRMTRTHDPGHNAQGSFCHRSYRGLVLGAHDFHCLEAAVKIEGCAFRLLLIEPLQMHQSVEEANVVPIGRRVGAVGPSYLTPAFSEAHKWADCLHNRCLLRGPIGVGSGNSPKSCRAHALRASAPSHALGHCVHPGSTLMEKPRSARVPLGALVPWGCLRLQITEKHMRHNTGWGSQAETRSDPGTWSGQACHLQTSQAGGGGQNGGRGRGSGTQKCPHQKLPEQIFPTVNFVFSDNDHFGLGGGPPVPRHFNTSLGGGGVCGAQPWSTVVGGPPRGLQCQWMRA